MKHFISVAFVAVASLMQDVVQAVPTAPSNLQRRVTANYHDVPTVGYAALGGTTGGSGGPVVYVSTLADLKTYVNDEIPRVVVIQGTITGAEAVRIKSNKTVLGADGNAALVGVGFKISGYQNVILRNLKISFVLAGAGDAFGAQESTKLWLDHIELSSDLAHDIDFYDGLLDITHETTFVTVSNSYLHDHWKSSLISHSDSATTDTVITTTYVGNYWRNLDARGPSIRFGKSHIYNNYYKDVRSAINTRMGAQVLVEGNVFENVTKALISELSDEVGYAVERNNEFGAALNTAPLGTFTTAPYSYSILATSSVKASVLANAGAILTWDTTAPTTTRPVTSTSTTKASTTTTKASTTKSSTTTTKSSTTSKTSTKTSSTSAASTTTLGAPYAQCGGSGWTGPTACVSGWTCVFSSEWYSQCVQA